MHLKSLTLRGFKSFASATTLDFEPGITAVVGPNGSGKSNVVDAIAWVMGEQGAKTLRGGKMEDVIFEGTPERPPLGRAEVVLTIDNSDNALPIDYTEVTISRTLFRSGGSEYAINGEPARLLDVQELLSDSGIGREMHVIVGQGRLDSILRATPDDRRGFIEEAAGVLKHRKRKEKALRKLDAMSANLTRLQDLTHELRRQLKPLGRQAEVARRAQVIQSDVRDSQLRLLADDVVNVQSDLDKEEADEAALRARRGELDARLERGRTRESEIEDAGIAQAEELARANELHTRLTALRERYRGLIALAEERAAYLDEPEASPSGTDPEVLEQQAQDAAQAAAAIEQDLTQLIADHEARTDEALAAQESLETVKRQVAEHSSKVNRHREEVLRLQGSSDAVSSRIEARESDVARLHARRDEAAAALEQLILERSESTSDLPADDGVSLESLETAAEDARTAERAAKDGRDQARNDEQVAKRRVVELQARLEALALSQRSGSAAVLEQVELPGLGAVASSIRVEAGFETAVEAALEFKLDADAVAVADLAAAVSSLRALRQQRVGQANLLIASADSTGTADIGELPHGVRRASDLVSVNLSPNSAVVTPAVRALLAETVIVPELSVAAELLGKCPNLTVVSSDGDVLTSTSARGGHDAGGELKVQAAIEQAQSDLTGALAAESDCTRRFQELEAALVDVRSRAEAAKGELEKVRQETFARNAEEKLAASRIDAARAEATRIAASVTEAADLLERDRIALQTAKVGLVELEAQAPAELDVSDLDIQELSAKTDAAREAKTQALLAVRTAEERVRALAARAQELRTSAETEREARAVALAAAAQRRRLAKEATEILAVAANASAELERALSQSGRRLDELDVTGRALTAELTKLRPEIHELVGQINALTSDVHRDEIARAEQRMRVEQLNTKALEEFGVAPDELLAEYGPTQLVPPSPRAPGDEVDESAPEPESYPFVRAEQEKRLRTAQKAMALLGRVNPLALEEFTAMEERYAFLNTQLEDLKGSRKDLLDIVGEVDARIQEVFAQAYSDVAREFEGVFSRLFPGGEGRLVLTDPTDLLTTGIEVEARPAGKRVKRLSLLSGGERSLTAVAFLVALFKARPSPFYIMDEVEAALDDVNLGRLIGLMEELRGTSQLLIITHQKRTMEIADALYGVTMRGGVTTVISQRVRELATTS